VDEAHLADAELAQDLLVALAGLMTERRRRRDHGNRGVPTARQRREAIQDHAVAGLVLRAADDDD
jgi:hypothetical protein